MRLASFRIINFRSIVDSGWTPFSPDAITVLVGQNESGKTSVLDALHAALSDNGPTADDFRIGAPLPIVCLRVELTANQVQKLIANASESSCAAVTKYMGERSNVIELKVAWDRETVGTTTKWTADPSLADSRLKELLDKAKTADALKATEAAGESVPADRTPPSGQPNAPVQLPSATATAAAADDEEDDDDDGDDGYLTPAEFASAVWKALPLSVLFNEETGRLPNSVDIDDKGQPTGAGARAALNFLQIAEIDLPALLKGDKRARENTLNRANARVSQDFNAFWSQTIGKEGKLSLKCDLDNYSASAAAEKVGKPHLVFWICDGNTQLYPKQRSQGVRWFVSFYLQLKASEKAKLTRMFLLDEPGANLHSKAQGDVLKLINKLAKDTSTVVYTTHSPQMIEHPKLYRVHAVQRDGELDESPTRIIDAHRLGAASIDTLSPILSAMGADLSQHQVIKKNNNVLLEEISGYYYLTSFWSLMSAKKEAHFIAATGVNKLETLANMFRGWGLNFVVAVDDDKQGREVFKNLKRDLCGDDSAIAAKYLVKLPHGTGIEDVFDVEDFTKYVLTDDAAMITGTVTEFLKTAGRSKPVLASRVRQLDA
jgi:ABC-type lipoprotein export system ATPase subunit